MEIRRLLWLLPLLVVGTLLELQGQFRHVVVDLLLFLHLVADAGVCMHHRGVVLASKHLADVVQAHAGELTHQIHGDLTRQRDLLRTRTSDNVIERNVCLLYTSDAADE